MKKIALVGPADRPEIQRMAIRLEERGARPIVLDSRQDPRLEFGTCGETACGQDLGDIEGAYVSDLGIPSPTSKNPDGSLDAAGSRTTMAASLRHFAAWFSLLVRWSTRMPLLNPPTTYDLHGLKPWEMFRYRRLGLPIPATIATSDPEPLLAVNLPAGSAWIRKGMAGGYDYTEAFAPPTDRARAAALLQAGPLMIQARINGDNVRAYLLDGRCLGAAEIVTLKTDNTDSRRGDFRVRPVDLPESARAAARAAAETWGMVFSGVDFMRDAASGEYHLLECNSAPFFVNFGKHTGLDIASHLAEYLVRGAPTEG